MGEARLDAAVRRNTLLLAATMAVYSAVLQLVAAVSSLTFVLITGTTGLLGLGPAIFLTAAALTAMPAGRAMDRLGRRPVIAGGYACAAIGCALTALAANVESTPLVIVGFGLTGAASGVALLIRAAAGDMYPPARRARGISYVLFGSVFGAILGPAVFSPLFAGRDLEASALTAPWLAASAISVVALGLVALVRPDPKRIAEVIAADGGAEPAAPAVPLRVILLRPGVRPAMLTALASFGVMVSVMNLSGYVVVEHHHHHQQDVFPVIGAHVLGMYALVIVVGTVIDRLGRAPALAAGLGVMAASTAGLLWVESVAATAVLLFGLGVGWNVSFVAATAQLVDRTSPAERGGLLGFTDLLSGLLGAALALIGGYALDTLGVAALALGATAIVAAPILWLLPRRARSATAAVLLVALVAPLAGAAPADAARAPRGVSLVWGGDVTLGSSYGRPPDRGWPQLAPIAPVLRAADVAAVNYEGTFGSGGPSKCGGGKPDCYAFQAPPANARTLHRAGIDVVNQANNHADDFGPYGQRATHAALRSAGVRWTGAPDQVTVLRRHGVRIAFAGFSTYPWSAPMTSDAAVRSLVRAAARRARIVVAFLHAGAEGASKVHVPYGHEHAFGEDRGDSRRFAHVAIDAGADLVLGSGPHVVRGLQLYRGRLIAYSLGNLTGWHNFGTGGASALSALLRVQLERDGALRQGRLYSLRLDGTGVPHPDAARGAERLMRGLSASDFGVASPWRSYLAELLSPGRG